ncbi:unnamed protein product [Euphydryas editha]|uniref:Uncharacterized protein n=1 Tax=Euphydryas editha TaxID=104508 RepID=A0AAU9U887_EUPED|nr:unnamed protein product [Euphydryas editha]
MSNRLIGTSNRLTIEFELACDSGVGIGTLRSANALCPYIVDLEAIEEGAPPGIAVEPRPGDWAPNVGVTCPETPLTNPEPTLPPTPPLVRLLGACWKFKFAIP